MTEDQYSLLLLQEECAEVAQICNKIAQRASKTLRFGWEEIQPGDARTNQERLEEELIDLFTIVSDLADRGHLSPEFLLKCYVERSIVDRMDIKESKIEKYKKYSTEINRIDIK